MTLTLAELLCDHRQQAKLTAGADRDFHLAAVKLLHGLVKQKSEHQRRIHAVRRGRGKRARR